MAERQVPGGQYVNETGTAQRQIPGWQFVNETVTAGSSLPTLTALTASNITTSGWRATLTAA